MVVLDVTSVRGEVDVRYVSMSMDGKVIEAVPVTPQLRTFIGSPTRPARHSSGSATSLTGLSSHFVSQISMATPGPLAPTSHSCS